MYIYLVTDILSMLNSQNNIQCEQKLKLLAKDFFITKQYKSMWSFLNFYHCHFVVEIECETIVN